MKLKIKETGEVLEDVKFIDTSLHKITIQYLDDNVLREHTIKNFSDIEEVKEVNEQEKFWYIEGDGDIHSIRTEHCDELEIHTMNRIGNHFETKEEAEKAVERLRAWKRLKDKGFFFDGRTAVHNNTVKIRARVGVPFVTDELVNDLDLLFGGDE